MVQAAAGRKKQKNTRIFLFKKKHIYDSWVPRKIRFLGILKVGEKKKEKKKKVSVTNIQLRFRLSPQVEQANRLDFGQNKKLVFDQK